MARLRAAGRPTAAPAPPTPPACVSQCVTKHTPSLSLDARGRARRTESDPRTHRKVARDGRRATQRKGRAASTDQSAMPPASCVRLSSSSRLRAVRRWPATQLTGIDLFSTKERRYVLKVSDSGTIHAWFPNVLERRSTYAFQKHHRLSSASRPVSTRSQTPDVEVRNRCRELRRCRRRRSSVDASAAAVLSDCSRSLTLSLARTCTSHAPSRRPFLKTIPFSPECLSRVPVSFSDIWGPSRERERESSNVARARST